MIKKCSGQPSKARLGKGGWGGKISLSRSDSILLKGLWDDWGQGWQTVTGAFLGLVKDILSTDSFAHDLCLLWCSNCRAETLQCGALPQRPYGPIGSPRIFVLCFFFFFPESAYWNFFWDLKKREGDKKRGMCERVRLSFRPDPDRRYSFLLKISI